MKQPRLNLGTHVAVNSLEVVSKPLEAHRLLTWKMTEVWFFSSCLRSDGQSTIPAAGVRGVLKSALVMLTLFGTLLSVADAAESTETIPSEPSNIVKGFAEIRNPKRLGVTQIPVERLDFGKYYKPSIIRLPNDELRVVSPACEPHKSYSQNEQTLFGTTDGGRTLTRIGALNVAQGEPYLVPLKDGTLLTTGSSSTPEGLCYLHRSEDGGITWTSPPTAVPPPGKTWISTRNVLELSDGSLLAGISEHTLHGRTYLWRSFDGGRTWSEKYLAQFDGVPEDYPYTMMGESYLWQARSGKIYAILRVGFRNSWPLPGTTDPGVNDHSERMVVYSTLDIGKTWQKVRDLGWYGEYYPSILRLHDGRLLLTFTMREPFGPNNFPHGLRAVVGKETEDGFEFDMQHDRVMLDVKAPHLRYTFSWSGSIGGTVQMDDGTLVSVYSYGGYPDGDSAKNLDFRGELIRWRLPESQAK